MRFYSSLAVCALVMAVLASASPQWNTPHERDELIRQQQQQQLHQDLHREREEQVHRNVLQQQQQNHDQELLQHQEQQQQKLDQQLQLLEEQQPQNQEIQQQPTPRPPPGSLDRLPEYQKIVALDDGQLQRFLGNAASVKSLADCFVDPSQCRSKIAVRLIKQIRSLRKGGKCDNCSPQQQERLNQIRLSFIQGLQTRHPEQWRRIVPNLGHLISAVPLK